MDQDQTAPLGSSLFWVHIIIANNMGLDQTTTEGSSNIPHIVCNIGFLRT